MQKGSKNVLRHAAAYLLARGIPGIVSFLAIPLFTRMLDPDAYCNYALAVTTVGLVNALAFQWIRLSFVRFLPASKANPQPLKSTLLTCQLLLAALGGFVVLGIEIIPEARPWRTVALVCWLLLGIQPLFELFCEQARALIQPRYYMGLQLGKSLLTTGLGAAFILLGFGWWGPLLGLAIGTLIPTLYAYGHDWRGLPLQIDRAILRRVCRYGIPLSLTVALAIVIASSDRYLIAYYLGASAAGVYSAAVDFTSQTLNLLMLTISLAVVPLAIRAWEEHGPEAAREQMRHNATLLLAVGIPAVVGLALLSGNVSHCFLGREFRETGARIMPIIALGTFLSAYKAYHLDSAFQFVHRTGYQVWIVLVAAAANVGLNLALIRPFGIIGAAGASVIAYLLSMAMTAAYGRRYFALPFPVRDCMRVLAASALMAVTLYLVRDYRGGIALTAQVSAGAAIYGLVLFLLDFLDLRSSMVHRFTSAEAGAAAPGVPATAQ